MASRYAYGELAIVLDCADLDRAASFWSAVLGYVRASEPQGPYLALFPRGGFGPELLLQQVPTQKREKNRMHFDLRTRDLDAEVARVRALGAVRLTHQPLVEAGWRWHVLADPDGNEFCLLQPPASYWTSGR